MKLAPRRLVVRDCIQRGDANQKDNSPLARNSVRFHHASQTCAKLVNCLFLKFFHLIFSEPSWLQVTETRESETMDKGRLLYSLWKSTLTFPLLPTDTFASFFIWKRKEKKRERKPQARSLSLMSPQPKKSHRNFAYLCVYSSPFPQQQIIVRSSFVSSDPSFPSTSWI